uniref:Uncharacterized protein n=1 Tax=Arundo donax TaxID=35708 RepID=A0A0A9HNZ1_ARUDO
MKAIIVQCDMMLFCFCFTKYS